LAAVLANGLLLLGTLLFLTALALRATSLGPASTAGAGTCLTCTEAAASFGLAQQDDGSFAGPPSQLASKGITFLGTVAAGLWYYGPPIGIALFAALSLAIFRVRNIPLSKGKVARLAPVLVICLLLVSAVYLGRPQSLNVTAATATAPATELVTYQSDFAHGYITGWFVQPGTNSLATVGIVSDSGTKVLSASAHNAPSATVFYNAGEDWQNLTVSVMFKGVNGTQFDLYFRDQMVVSTYSSYRAHIDVNAQVVSLLKSVALGSTPAVLTNLAQANFAFSRNVWYTISIVANGGTLQVSFNGVRIISTNDPSPITYGTIAFNSQDVYGSYRIASASVTAQVPPQSTWQQLGGPDGGQIQALDIDPANTNIVYAGAVHTGVLKSDNKGDFWREVGYSNGMTGTKANIVTVAPSNSSIVYASLEDSSTGGGAYRSDDGGLHWRALSQGLSGYFVNAISVDPTNPNVVYLATERTDFSTLPVGLEKSLDGGTTYTTLVNAQVDTIAVSRSNPRTVYIGTLDQGLLRSDDAGASWRNITPAGFVFLPPYPAPFNRVVIDPQNSNIVIAHQGILNLGGRTCGPIFRSTDSGNTWSVISENVPYFGQNFCSPSGGLTDVAQSISSPTALYCTASYPNGTGAYFRSDDSGATWRQLKGGMAAPPEVVKIDPTNPDVVYIGTFGEGIYRTVDGGATLTHVTTGLLGGGIYALAIYPGKSNIIFASRSINGFGEFSNSLGTLAKSVDGGISWSDYNGPPFNIVDIQIDQTNPSTMYAATSGSPNAKGTGLWKTTDGGANWMQKNQGLAYLNLTTIAINPSNPNVLLVGTGHRPYGGTAGGGIYKSADGGNTWHKVSIPNLEINRILINPSNPNVIYAATFGGGVYKSTDGGENWSQANAGIGNNYVYALAINPAQPDTLYAGINPFYADPSSPESNSAVFKSTDGGSSWNLVLLDRDVEWILLDPGNPQSVYEGNHGGYISWSADGGSTWTYGSEMIRRIGGHAYMWAATTDPGRRALLIGTCGRGVFINRLATAEVPTPTWLKIPFNEAYFSATFLSNSSFLDFRFSQAASSFVFTTVGAAGTRALVNVSIPTNLLAGPYSLSLDGASVAPTSTKNLPAKNLTQILVSFVLNGKSQLLIVQGSLVTTTTTSSTTSRTTTATTQASSTSSSSSTISASSSSSSSTTSTSTSPGSTSSATLSSLTTSTSSVTSSQPTVVTSSQTTSTAGSSGGGIPEFPYEIFVVAALTAVIVISYLLVRRRN